jgi:two-component system, OmpR family, sensor histidine kinase ChvG
VNKLFIKVFLLLLTAPLVLLLGLFSLRTIEKTLQESSLETLQLQAEVLAKVLSEQAVVPTKSPSFILQSQRQAKDGYFLQKPSFDDGLNAPAFQMRIPEKQTAVLSADVSQKIIESLSGFQEVGISLFDQNAFLLSSTQKKNAFLTTQEGALLNDIGSVLSGGKPVRHVLSGGGLRVFVPVRRGEKGTGVLMIEGTDADVVRKTAQVWQMILGLFLLTLMLTGAMAFYLTLTIVTPLRELAAGALKTSPFHRNIPDLTGRKDDIGVLSGSLIQMTDALQQRLKAIEAFAGDVAHELKNPLTSLKNAVEMLPLIKTQEKRATLFQIIQEDILRMEHLITDVSDMSRLDAEIARETRQNVNVFSLIGQMREKGVLTVPKSVFLKVEFEKKAKRVWVSADESRLAQVFVNLVENAVSFSPDKGRIWIKGSVLSDFSCFKEKESFFEKKTLEKNDTAAENEKETLFRHGKNVPVEWNKGVLKIEIEDEGTGLRSGDEEKIFQRFYSNRPSSKQTASGTLFHSGIGLAICRQIMEAFGGVVYAENRQPPLKGARFVLLLPLIASYKELSK